MRSLLALVAVVLAFPAAARAETAVKLQSCAEALVARDAYTSCLAANGKYGFTLCKRLFPPTSQCWDFEPASASGGFGTWTFGGKAFANQPTYGDNVVTSRVGLAGWQQLKDIGGSYWEAPFPIGHQGSYWLGTYENRQSPSSAWGKVRGDGPTGAAYSPSFTVDRDYIWFLVGGGCDINTVYVELQVWNPASNAWERAKHAVNGSPFTRSGFCTELFIREGWYTDAATGLQGKTVRLAVVDFASGSWGHINVDHIVHTSALINDFNGANQPVWGFADTHAHVGNHQSFQSAGNAATGNSRDGYIFHGSPGHMDPNLLVHDLGSCDGETVDYAGHGALHDTSSILLSSMESMSFGVAAAPGYPSLGVQFFPPAGPFSKKSHPAGGMVSPYTPNARDLEGWPYWWSRVHQQMHVTWIHRSYKGGQRLLVAAAGNGEALGSMMRAYHNDRAGYVSEYVSDFGALRRFASYMQLLAQQNSTWMEIARSPQDARRIIRANKLAIVLATEVDDLGDHCAADLKTSSGASGGADFNKTTTTSTNGANPWNQMKDRSNAGSCTTGTAWASRVQNLYEVGYRIIMPVHLSDNDLGGAAVYGGEMFNAMNRFNRGNWFELDPASGPHLLTFAHSDHAVEVGWCEGTGCASASGMAWAVMIPILQVHVWTKYTPVAIGQYVSPSYPPAAGGHMNRRALQSNGEVVLAEAKARGMLIDLAHMGRKGREKVLGLKSNATTSIVASTPGCDMTTAACQAAAYPAIATHAGLYMMSGQPNENDLDPDMIERIRVIGGTIAVGTSGGDLRDTSIGGGPSTGIYAQNVANTCAGSTRTFSQGYIYALRAMQGKGVTLGTDINGLEAQLNPRYGTLGCYARGNVPWVLQYSAGGKLIVSAQSWVPYNNRKEIIVAGSYGTDTAGAQRWVQRVWGTGLNYKHYNGTPPNQGNGLKFSGLFDSVGWEDYVRTEGWKTAKHGLGQLDAISMSTLTSAPPLEAQVTGNRTFDYNYDGLAHYGMLPDMLQDTLAVGMTPEQLGPLFQSAEYLIQAWEKSCRLSTPSVSSAGCQ